jgi:hypothetical protein
MYVSYYVVRDINKDVLRMMGFLDLLRRQVFCELGNTTVSETGFISILR